MERLTKQRATSRGWVTRASRALEELTKKENVTDIELTTALSDFDTRLQHVDNIQSQLEQEIEQSDLDNVLDEAFAYRQKHVEVKVRAETVLQTLRESKEKQLSDSQSMHGEAFKHHNHLNHARLPKLELPKFGGNYLEFFSFFDKFLAVVDSSDLPAVSKFTYLQSLLTGEALASIKGLSVTDESYPVAKEILQQRYGRKERIIFAHIQKLLSLQVDFRKSNGLWHLFDSLQSHVRCLETLGVTGNTYGVILTPLVLSRIPSEIRLEWARDGEGRESDLNFLLEFLYKEIKRRERSLSFQSAPEQRKAKELPSPSVATFHTNSAERQSKQCNFCNKMGHRSEECFSIRGLNSVQIMDKVKELGLCFICLGKHFSKKCGSKRTCHKCKRFHHSLLCGASVSSSVRPDSAPAIEEDTIGAASKVNYAHVKNKTTVMQVVKTTLRSVNDKSVEMNILFDGGSDRSFISQSMARKLNLNGVGEERFAFSGFGDAGCGPRTKRKIFNIELGGVLIEVAGIPTICADMYRKPIPENVLRRFDVTFPENYSKGRSVKIDILIGLDYYWTLVTCDMMRVDSLVAQRTRCGWMLSGEYTGKSDATGLQLLCVQPVSDNLVRSLWELDGIGIRDNGCPTISDKVINEFDAEIAYQDGRYVVGLPWKDQLKGKLINNKAIAEKRLVSLSKKLTGKPALKEAYNQSLKEMEESGIIKEVSSEGKHAGLVFYLPHRPVIKNDSKTTKVRPVFDASAKGFNGLSLNDCLEAGPNLLPNLLEILLRFRRWKIAVTADVTKAFLQIKVKQEDQHVLRFLWEQEGKTRNMMFDRVPFGTKSSPFLLNATIKHHLKKYPESKAVVELENNLYVDDLLSGADTVEEACQLVSKTKGILADASMDLTKWSSNNKHVADTIMKEFDPRFDVSDTTKVLGLKWMPTEDCFSFNGMQIPEDLVVTKRVVLSFIARLFDPLGFFTPFTITAKIMFQKLWELGVDWDSQLSDSFCHQFGKWLKDIEDLQRWKIPRCLVASSWVDASNKQIHVFCDASESAYGCCAYLRTETENGVNVSLLLAKARVAPLKRLTLPRLELIAAVLGARMVRFIKTALNLPKDIPYKCYTDSMITLQWIQSSSYRWKTFVANRVQEIQDATDPSNWKHCAGIENPADLMTRGATARHLMTSSLWLRGPEWLQWNRTSPGSDMNIEEGEYMLSEERQVNQCVNLESKADKSFLQMTKWSSLGKITRVVGWVLRFIDRCSKKRRDTNPQLKNDELLTAFEVLVRQTQLEHYENEMKLIKVGKAIGKSSSLHKLYPFLGDDGMLRARCRLNYSELSYDEKFPIILPKGQLSLLIVRETHTKLKHAGVNQMITTVRGQYWIIGLRSIAKKVKGECLPCKYLDAKACQEPVAPLLEARLKQAQPFNTVGIDYAGPVYCKDGRGKKFYILLFTCAVIRAVHLELVGSLSLPHFLLALRRFVARRGIPSTIYSDNAQTFKGASNEIHKLYGCHSPKWRFSVPRAPWWGGWWERMIRNMKTSLKKTIGLKCLNKTELETTLIEVESCLNSRPLTFVGDDIENGHPLTPSHFLLGRGSHLEKVDTQPSLIVSAELLRDEKSLMDARVAMFWQKWQDEYLKQLPLPKRRDKFGKIQIGSIVLIREDNCPRLQWPLGIIEELIEGRDGISRAVRVKTKRGSFVRPIQRIHDLELHAHPITTDPEAETVSRSKHGRVIKPPERYS